MSLITFGTNLKEIEFLCLLIFLYAEIHYAFKGIYSRLKVKEPEIVADLPHRLEANCSFPVLIIIKDADKYPILLENVQIELRGLEQRDLFEFEFDSLPISNKFWHQILQIKPSNNLIGRATVDVAIWVTMNGKKRVVKNDNYACASHQAEGFVNEPVVLYVCSA